MTLDQWMSKNGVKDAELARKVGVSRPFITRIRAGARQPSLPVALRLAAATKLPVSSFTRGAA